jgi:hypothetical protein
MRRGNKNRDGIRRRGEHRERIQRGKCMKGFGLLSPPSRMSFLFLLCNVNGTDVYTGRVGIPIDKNLSSTIDKNAN